MPIGVRHTVICKRKESHITDMYLQIMLIHSSTVFSKSMHTHVDPQKQAMITNETKHGPFQLVSFRKK